MKKVFITLAVILIAIVLCFCHLFVIDYRVFLKNDTERVESYLKAVKVGEEFDLSQVCTSCDSVFLVEPYDAEFFDRNSHLKLMPFIKRSILSDTWYDDRYQMLFVKGNKVVSFAKISGGYPFREYNNQGLKFPVNAKLYLDAEKGILLK